MTPRQMLSKAREGTLDHMPYLTRYVYSLRATEVTGYGTMGVSKDGVLFWDADFVRARPMDALVYLVIHETLHLLLRHHARAVECYGEYPSPLQRLVMNISADLVVEQMMSSMRGIAPGDRIRLGCYVPELRVTLNLPPNLDMLEYYRRIMALVQSQGSSSSGEPDDSGTEEQGQTPDADTGGRQQGGGRPPAPQPESPHGSAAPSASESSASTLMRHGGSASDGVARPWETPDPTWEAFQEVVSACQADQELRQAHMLNPGSVPGNLLEAVRQFLRPQPSPWDHLRSAVAGSVTSPIGGRQSTYRRLSRKQPEGMCRLRGYTPTQSHAVVVVDTSGSMHDRETKERALQVIADGLRKLKTVEVVCADTRIRTSKRLSTVENFRWVGGGGTDMASVISQVDRERRPDSIVVVTDAATRWPAQTRARLVVALTSNDHQWRQAIPSWAKVVLLKE